MLSERITALFMMLECNNTDIARYAGCSSGNISKLKTGNRVPKPTSRSIKSLADGIYGYADFENMLPTLQELCHCTDTARENMIPALIAWLYETDEIVLPAQAAIPKSKRTQMLRRQSFGDRLDRAVTLLGLSNSQLAALLNIDVSLVSRYRSGIYSPHGNARLAEKLSDVLLNRAQRTGKAAEFAALCGTDAAQLDTDTVAAWLYDLSPAEYSAAMAQVLLRSLDEFTADNSQPETAQEVPDTPETVYYYGTGGLRSAVARFLADAAKEGGELLLYSDEPTDWLVGDRAYFALWTSLMEKCVNSGVEIKIIHTIDRESAEANEAIRGWLPLYVSGMIEPFFFRKKRDPRFCHTVLLRPGGACIHGAFPAASGESRWYEYITDQKRLDLMQKEFDSMLCASSQFLNVYNGATSEDYYSSYVDTQGSRAFLLSGFPVFTMPEELLERIVSRAQMAGPLKSSVLSLYRRLRKQFQDLLRQGAVNMALCIPREVRKENIKVNFALELIDFSVDYTQDEYEEHLAAVMDLVKNEKNFHLTLLPEPPFRDIQLVMLEEAVSVLYCNRPYTAFVFYNSTLNKSVSDYLFMLDHRYAADRRTVLKALADLRHSRDRKTGGETSDF